MSRSESLRNEEVEQALLGALLVEPSKLDELEWFEAGWFYSSVHSRIYTVMLEAHRKGQAVGASYLAQYFEHDKDLEGAGGSQYIYELAENVVTVHGIKGQAEHIHELHLRRALLALGKRIQTAVMEVEIDQTSDHILSGVEKFIYESHLLKKQDEAASAKEGVEAAMLALQSPDEGLRTGLSQLDRMTKGLMPGALYIVAGRPAMGKTAFGLTLTVNLASVLKKVLFFSLEMTTPELMKRVIARRSGVPVHSRKPEEGEMEKEKVQAAALWASNLSFSVDDSAGLTASDIRARAKRYKRKHGLDAVVIDYLGMMAAEDKRANKVHQVEEITQGLKRLAKELQVPVVLLCQLSRAVEGRDDKRPQLSDLRDSGAIEQDADVVMFLYREEYYLNIGSGPVKKGIFSEKAKEKQAEKQADKEAMKGVAELIIAKQRQGETGTLELCFDGARQVFEDRLKGSWV